MGHDELTTAATAARNSVVHQMLGEGEGLTPCCGRTLFELPRTDRMSNVPGDVTCAPHSEEDGPVYPPHDSWLPQLLNEEQGWVSYAPTEDRAKALERVRTGRAENPGVKYRLVKITTSYTVEEEEE